MKKCKSVEARTQPYGIVKKKVGNINACICNNNSNGRIGKKDDLVIVEGSDKLDDQWWSDDAIFHLQSQGYKSKRQKKLVNQRKIVKSQGCTI